jgi:hypothetical protein
MHEGAAAVGGDVDDADAGALRAGVDTQDSDHIISLRGYA